MRGWTAAGRCSSVSPPALPLQACSSPAACIGSVWFAEGLGSCAAGSQCNSPFACASCQALNHQAAEQPRAAALQGPPPFRLASVKWAFPRLNSCRTKVHCPPLLHSIPTHCCCFLAPCCLRCLTRRSQQQRHRPDHLVRPHALAGLRLLCTDHGGHHRWVWRPRGRRQCQQRQHRGLGCNELAQLACLCLAR